MYIITKSGECLFANSIRYESEYDINTVVNLDTIRSKIIARIPENEIDLIIDTEAINKLITAAQQEYLDTHEHYTLGVIYVNDKVAAKYDDANVGKETYEKIIRMLYAEKNVVDLREDII